MARKRTGRRRPRLEVWKFGGASVADAAAVRHAVALVRAHRGPLVVVVSALAGVTDALLDGSRRAVAGDPAAATAVAATFRRRHRELAAALVPRGAARVKLLASADAQAREYEEIAHAMAALADLSARASDTLVARGERAASAVVAAALHATGRRAVRVDATEFVSTDGRHGAAAADIAATRRQARALLLPLLRRGVTPVVPGFIGAGPDGTVTTLGRGGSDLTATLVARSLGAASVVLWKDVAGFSRPTRAPCPTRACCPSSITARPPRWPTSAPKCCTRARSSRSTARGSRSTCARSPTRSARAPRSRRASTLADYPVKALATIRGQALVTVAGKGLMGVPGMAARTFEALHAEASRSRPSSSPPRRARSASRCRESRPTARSRRYRPRSAMSSRPALVDGVSARHGVAVIAVVGRGMAGTPGVAARVFTALSASRINVIAIAQGSSELTSPSSWRRPRRRRRRGASTPRSSSARSAAAARRATAPTSYCWASAAFRGRSRGSAAGTGNGRIRIVAVLDRSGYVFDARGLSRAPAAEARRGQGQRQAAGGPGRRAAPPRRRRSTRSPRTPCRGRCWWT